MDFDQFLREAARLLGLQWRRFGRRGTKRKLERRICLIGLSRFEEYLAKLREDPSELRRLSQILTVTISRFFRDHEVFSVIGDKVIPSILKEREEGELRIWSIGCASGEEPYSLSLLWRHRFEAAGSKVRLSILAVDIDENLLERAREGRYRRSSLTEVPPEILQDDFKKEDGFYILDEAIRRSVQFKKHDLVGTESFSEMDLVFCRNLAFTYFAKERQIDVMRKIALSLRGRGYLVIGKEESLPLTFPTLFVPVFPDERIYQKFEINPSIH